MLYEGTYKRKTALKNLKSDSGKEILFGDTYFYNKEANSILSLNEGEVELLGLKDYSTEKRKELAKKGHALRDGSYPIVDCGDAKDAIHRIGTGGAAKSTIRAHIRKRVKALGCTGSTFDNFK